jgi:predicted permease
MPPLAPDDPATREYASKYRTWRLAVDETFFDTFGIPILRGRTFPATVSPESPRVVVVNEALAKLLFNTTDVVGRRMMPSLDQDGEPLEVVGVARDAHYTSLRTSPPPTAYLPYQQSGHPRTSFAVKTAGNPLALADAVRETMRRLDPALPLFNLITQEGQIRRSLARERLFANLALLLGAVTLALSGIGLYGLLAYAVTRRTPEIGVRIALGAETSQVRWMILRQSLVLVVAGLALGVPAAYASAGFVESLLFGLSPYDPRALAAGIAIMLLAGLLAAYIPARRASRIDPITALRSE